MPCSSIWPTVTATEGGSATLHSDSVRCFCFSFSSGFGWQVHSRTGLFRDLRSCLAHCAWSALRWQPATVVLFARFSRPRRLVTTTSVHMLISSRHRFSKSTSLVCLELYCKPNTMTLDSSCLLWLISIYSSNNWLLRLGGVFLLVLRQINAWPLSAYRNLHWNWAGCSLTVIFTELASWPICAYVHCCHHGCLNGCPALQFQELTAQTPEKSSSTLRQIKSILDLQRLAQTDLGESWGHRKVV